MFKTRLSACAAIAVAALLSCGPVRAQSNCDAALVMSTYNSTSSVGLDWRMASLVTETEWNDIHKNGSASALIYGVPVGASYSEYENSAKRYRDEYGESLSYHQQLNVAWTGIDPNSPSLYKTCLMNNLFDQNGLHAAVLGATRSDITILVRWRDPNSPGPLRVRWVAAAQGSEGILARFPSLVPQGDTTIIVPRPSSEFSIAGNANGSSTYQIVLEPLPAPPPKVKTIQGQSECNVPKGGRSYFIQSHVSDLFLDRRFNNKINGGDIDQAVKNKQQTWKLTASGRPSLYYIRSPQSHLCLDVSGANRQIGGKVDQAVCNPEQVWRIECSEDFPGYYYILSNISGLYLDVRYASRSVGAPVDQAARHPSQVWRFLGN